MIDDPKLFQGERPEVAAVQIGFVSINIFTLLIAIFTSVNTLQSYLARERLVLLLSEPLKRWQILEGVVLGLFEIMFLNWCLMTGGVWLVIISQAKIFGWYVWTGMAVTALMAFFYVSLVVFLYCLIPNVIAGVFAFLLIIAGFGASLARELFAKADYPFLVKEMLLLGLQALPKINALWGLSMKELGLFDLKVTAAPLVLHTIGLCLFLNLISCWKFRRFFQSLT